MRYETQQQSDIYFKKEITFENKESFKTIKTTQNATPPIPRGGKAAEPKKKVENIKQNELKKIYKEYRQSNPYLRSKETYVDKLKKRLASMGKSQTRDDQQQSERGASESAYSGSILQNNRIHSSMNRSEASISKIPSLRQNNQVKIKTSKQEFHPLQIQKNIEKNSVDKQQ